MWIAIQHLYGMYTDFKKTINPIQYYDSNNNDEFDCDGSIISARMADRPPVKTILKLFFLTNILNIWFQKGF